MIYNNVIELERYANTLCQRNQLDAAKEVWKRIEQLTTQHVLQCVNSIEWIDDEVVHHLQHHPFNGEFDCKLNSLMQERKMLLKRLGTHAEWLAKYLQNNYVSPKAVKDAAKQHVEDGFIMDNPLVVDQQPQ